MVWKRLKDYARADYAREILADNADKPLNERARLVFGSDEHKKRRVFARARASCLLFSSIPLLVVSAIDHGADNPMIGSYRLSDFDILLGLVLYLVIALAMAWRIGTRLAEKEIARNHPP